MTAHQEEITVSLPQIASREDWLAARTELLAEEKALTRARDALNTKRRELPMVEVDKHYLFEGPSGRVGLLDLFDGRRQLIVGHFMFDPAWDAGCPSCSAGADEWSPGLESHLATRDTTLVYVSRAPLDKIERYRAEKGWGIPWFSSYGSDFNHDFGVTLHASDTPPRYNYAPAPWHEEGSAEMPGLSCFLRVDDRVFHTYSQYARGAESTGGSYYFLDLTALGRQEEWEQPKGRSADARGATPNFAT